HTQRSTFGRLTKNKQNTSRVNGRVRRRGWLSATDGAGFQRLFLYLFVTLPNSLVTPGEKSSQFTYSNLFLPMLQRGINTLPKYFLLVEQLHFGRVRTNKQTSSTMQVLQRVCGCSCAPARRGAKTNSLKITTKLIALCYLRPELM
ncbi:unnamed protein product, partial [Meganyctiphanes norvegica]